MLRSTSMRRVYRCDACGAWYVYAFATLALPLRGRGGESSGLRRCCTYSIFQRWWTFRFVSGARLLVCCVAQYQLVMNAAGVHVNGRHFFFFWRVSSTVRRMPYAVRCATDTTFSALILPSYQHQQTLPFSSWHTISVVSPLHSMSFVLLFSYGYCRAPLVWHSVHAPHAVVALI